jgi:PAS domain S-box-containing protein
VTLCQAAPKLMRLLAPEHAAVLDTTAEGVAILDASGHYAYVNARLAQMLGREPAELSGLDPLDFVDPGARDAVRASLSRRAKGPVEELDVALRRADGARVPVLLALSPLVDDAGRYAGALALTKDASERGRDEEALRLLAKATSLLSRSFEYEVTLANLARSLVPQLGDTCTIRLREDGALLTFGRCGEPVEGGTRLFVPLIGRHGVLGVMTLQSATRGFDDVSRRLASELASLAALAVEHARLHREVQHQRGRLHLLMEVSRALSGALDLEAVVRVVASAIEGGLLVGFLQPDGRALVAACTSTDPHIQKRMSILLGRKVVLPYGTLAEEVVRTRRTLLIHRKRTPLQMCGALAALAIELDLSTVIASPLLVRGAPIGVMCAFRGPKEAPFGPDEVSLIDEIAERAAMAFERAQLLEGERRLTGRLRLLADVGSLLAQSLELEPTVTTLARLTVQSFADACFAALFDGEGRITMQAVAAHDDPGLEGRVSAAVEPYEHTKVSLAPSALRDVLEAGLPRLWAEVDDDVMRSIAMDEAQAAALLAIRARSMIIVPIFAHGAPLGAMAMARTQGGAYDEEDLAVATEVGRRVALALENARLFRRATEAIAVRDEFLAIAGHELNTPLTSLKMHLDSLCRGTFGPERTAAKLEAASRQTTRLAKLVNEMLDLSRITGGRLPLEPERFDLAVLVDEAVAHVGEDAEGAGSTIRLRAERPCFGSWDRMRLEQVVANLLTNAIKYGAGKPIDVELARGPGARVRIVVRDHGIGIPREDQRRIFERFERAASARHYGGLGLGLWITRQIVEASGGSIAVDSEPGRGSTFVVDLPCTG